MSLEAKILHQLSKQPSVSIHDLLTTTGASRASLFRTLSNLVEQGRIVRLHRGQYQNTEQNLAADPWTQAIYAYPQGILCLLSALSFHTLTTQSPSIIWLALPKSAWHKQLEYPPVQIIHMSGEALQSGIGNHERAGGIVRVYSVAKTVADCFKFRNRIGLDIAIEALREGWHQHRFTLDELDAMARVCRVHAVMRPYVEALTA